VAKLKKKLFLAFSAFLLAAVLSYCASIPVRSLLVYLTVKRDHRGWSERYFQKNELLGFTAIPNSQAEETFRKGPDVPSRFDGNGFRIPLKKPHPPGRRPLILALGDSFTFGAACLAEESYPYLLAEQLQGSEINAGQYGSGLAQMVLLAQRIVPRVRPDYVIVQYSPWLVQRALSPWGPTQFVKLPQPFFVRGPDGSLTIYPPVFEVFDDFTLGEYRQGDGGAIEFLHFTRNVTFPFLLHDDWNMLKYGFRRAARKIPSPFDDPNALVQQVYMSLAKLSEQHNSEMLILLMGCSYGEMPESFKGLGVTVVDGRASLCNRLETKSSEAYGQQYWHWYGDPPELIDTHPNANAHKIYAEVLERAIRRNLEK